MSSLIHHFQSNSLSPAAFISWVAYVFEEPVNWLFILSRYSVTVSHSMIEPHNCRLNCVLYHSQIFFVDSDPLPMLKVIGHLLGFKIPLSSCPSGISLVCLPHRCYRLSRTLWGNYLVHLNQDEDQVNLFLSLRVVVTFESGDLFDTTHQVVSAWQHNSYRVRT